MRASTFGSNAIKAADAKTPFLATILASEVVEFKRQDGGVDRKLGLVLDVAGAERKLSLNKTTIDVLTSAFGDETDNWSGKRIAVYFDPSVEFGGKKVGGIRIKVPGVKSAAERALEAQRAAEAMFSQAVDVAAAAPAEAGRQPGDEELPVI